MKLTPHLHPILMSRRSGTVNAAHLICDHVVESDNFYRAAHSFRTFRENDWTGEKGNRIKGLIFVLSPQGQFYGLKLRGIRVQDKLEQKRKLEMSPRLLFQATVRHLGEKPSNSTPPNAPSKKATQTVCAFVRIKWKELVRNSYTTVSKRFHLERAMCV